MRWQHLSCHRNRLVDQVFSKYSAKANTQHISIIKLVYIIGWILGSPLVTSEGAIDVVTNVRNKIKSTIKGKTGDIDVRHLWRFLRAWVCHPAPFISATGSVRVADCLILHCHVQGGQWHHVPIHGVRVGKRKKGNKRVSSQSYEYLLGKNAIVWSRVQSLNFIFWERL